MYYFRFFFSHEFNRLFGSSALDSMVLSYQVSEADDAEALDRCVRGWFETNSSKLRFRTYSVPLGGQTDWCQLVGVLLEGDKIDLVRAKVRLLPNLPAMSKAVALVDKLDVELNPDFKGREQNRNGLFQTFVIDESWVKRVLGDLIDKDDQPLSLPNVAAALGKFVADSIEQSSTTAQ